MEQEHGVGGATGFHPEHERSGSRNLEQVEQRVFTGVGAEPEHESL